MSLKVTWLFTHKKSVNEIMEGIGEKVLKTADILIPSGLLLLNTVMSVFFPLCCSRLDL